MRLAGALAVLLCLTACGGEGEAAAPATTAAAPAPSESPVQEGAHVWPDGLTATVKYATVRPAVEPENPAEDTEVHFGVVFGNEGTETVTFGPSPNTIDAGPDVDLFYSANRNEAQSWYVEENNLPTQLPPGTTALWTAVFTLASSDLADLAVTVTPTPAHEPWTFTGIEVSELVP